MGLRIDGGTIVTDRPTESPRELRRRAEEKLASETEPTKISSPEETQQLLHELRVHQIELEMQNEELRTTQLELDAARASYFDLYELAPVGYLTVSGKGLIQKANLAAATMLGVKRNVLPGNVLSRFVSHEDEKVYYLYRKRLIEAGEMQVWEMRMMRAGGSPFWVHVQAGPAQGGDYWITLNDISKRKQAEEALEKLNAELESRVAQRTEELREKDQTLLIQSRQAAMGEMIGNIAHQWRQPLNLLGLTIQQFPCYYDHGELDRAFLNENVGKAMDLIQHMSKTIDDFRNYFKPDKEKIDFKVQEAIANTLTLLEGSLQTPKISVDIVAKDDLVIHGFANEFTQVLLNLLANARDALIEREVVDPRVTITMFSEDGCTVVTVADNAGGIPEEIIDKIFNPYFTTKGPQGTGVGLFMSKSIIEKNMGGMLTVHNIAGGTEFRIEVCNGIGI